jgi:hypothetical protein
MVRFGAGVRDRTVFLVDFFVDFFLVVLTLGGSQVMFSAG